LFCVCYTSAVAVCEWWLLMIGFLVGFVGSVGWMEVDSGFL